MLNLLLIGLSLTGQAPALEIVDPRPTYGHLGAPRAKGPGLLPGDVANFSFGIKGLKFDDNGLAKYSVAIEIRDASGKLFYEMKPFNSVAQNVFGGDVVPSSATVAIPLNQKPTDLSWKVTVKDRTTNASVELKGDGKVLPADFGLVRIGTYADADLDSPVAPVGVVGGTIFLNFAAVGFQRDKDKKPEIDVELKVLDDTGKPTLPKAMKAKIRDDIDPDSPLIPLHFGLSLNRPGTFTIEVSAKCALSNKTATFSLPVRILATP